MEKFDYSNPETLFENTMSTISGGAKGKEEEGSEGFLGKVTGAIGGVLQGGIIGKFMATTNAAQAAANSIVLRNMGRGDLADKIDAQYGSYVKSSGIEMVPEAWRDGDRLAASVMENRKSVLDGWGTTTNTPTTAKKSIFAKPTQPSGGNVSTTRTIQDEDTAMSQTSGSRDTSNTGGGSGSLVTGGSKTPDTSSQRKAKEEKMATSMGSVKKDDGSYDISSWNKYNEGGLVSKPKAKVKPASVKKTTNKKGLGRK
jgi:hypothetical protein